METRRQIKCSTEMLADEVIPKLLDSNQWRAAHRLARLLAALIAMVATPVAAGPPQSANTTAPATQYWPQGGSVPWWDDTAYVLPPDPHWADDPTRSYRVIRYGQTQRSRLNSQSAVTSTNTPTRVEGWYFEGRQGDCVTVIMRSSDFDAVLGLGYSTQLGNSNLWDDDSGGGPLGRDAMIRIRLNRDTVYYITAGGYLPGLGEYSLQLHRC